MLTKGYTTEIGDYRGEVVLVGPYAVWRVFDKRTGEIVKHGATAKGKLMAMKFVQGWLLVYLDHSLRQSAGGAS